MVAKRKPGGKGPRKGAFLNDETSFRERKSGRARSPMLRSVGGFLLLCKPHRALPGHGVLAIFMNANPFRASRLLFLPFALLRRATWHFRETVFHPNRLALSTTSRSNYQRIRLVALPFYALEPQLSNSSKLFHTDIRYSRVSCNFFLLQLRLVQT